MEEKESFLKRKDIEISAKRYLQDALSAMALGLFGSLLIGVIFDTLGTQTANYLAIMQYLHSAWRSAESRKPIWVPPSV